MVRLGKQATAPPKPDADGTRDMSDFGTELARLMDARGVGVRELARSVHYNPGHISNLRSGKARPSAELARELDDYFAAKGTLAALAPTVGRASLTDELAAVELARRAEASDVSDGTVERLELAFDDLATAYPRTPSADLLSAVRDHLSYTTSLLDGHATLTQRRRLLVSGGWLSLLAATLLIDLYQERPAIAYLRTAEQLARETGHAEIGAWVLETRAWSALTSGEYRQALELSRAAQQAAPHGSSALIQATAQEGRAVARMGDAAETTRVLTRIEALVSPLVMPDRPEHHYRYDPAKAEAYTATTLAWVGDPAAEQFARDVLYRLESPVQGPPRHRRASSARLDLSLALIGRGKHDEAAGTALQAVTSGYVVPSNYWRAREVIRAVAARGVPEARELAEAYRAESGEQPNALP
jgi:transcriptional regulator with XRE-family HTH domain